jgi:Tc5 transposase DNA-binding domain
MNTYTETAPGELHKTSNINNTSAENDTENNINTNKNVMDVSVNIRNNNILINCDNINNNDNILQSITDDIANCNISNEQHVPDNENNTDTINDNTENNIINNDLVIDNNNNATNTNNLNNNTINHEPVYNSDGLLVLAEDDELEVARKLRIHCRHNFGYSIIQKIRIVEEAKRVGNIRATADYYDLWQGSIQYGIKHLVEYYEKSRKKPAAKTTNRGKIPFDVELEQNVNTWFEESEMEDSSIKTDIIIAYAVSLQPDFKQGVKKLLQHWVYRFMRRFQLTLRRVTHRGQKLSGHL